MDKFLVSETLNIKEVEIKHVSDNYYNTNLNMKKKFDHGAVRLLYNRKKGGVGPGQFKLDPYLVSCGALDSVVKEVIYEANIYNSNIPEIIDAYTERNKIAVLEAKELYNTKYATYFKRVAAKTSMFIKSAKT